MSTVRKASRTPVSAADMADPQTAARLLTQIQAAIFATLDQLVQRANAGAVEMPAWAGGTVAANGVAERILGATVTRTATGVYQLVLNTGLTEDQGTFLFTAVSQTPRLITHTHVSSTQIQVETFNIGGVHLDVDWHFGVWKL